MRKKIKKNIKNDHSHIDAMDVARDYVWGSTEEARRDAASIYLIHAIAEKYHGRAKVDFANHSIEISVPDGEKPSCLAEIEERTGMAFH